MVGGVGRLAGDWLRGLVPAVSFVGECFRACWELSCCFIWYSIPGICLFLCYMYRRALAKLSMNQRIRPRDVGVVEIWKDV